MIGIRFKHKCCDCGGKVSRKKNRCCDACRGVRLEKKIKRDELEHQRIIELHLKRNQKELEAEARQQHLDNLIDKIPTLLALLKTLDNGKGLK